MPKIVAGIYGGAFLNGSGEKGIAGECLAERVGGGIGEFRGEKLLSLKNTQNAIN